MKRFFSSVVMAAVLGAMAVAGCSKEDPKVAESSLVGTWAAPLSVGNGEIQGLGGKCLVINPDHTAVFEYLSFNYWKVEGDKLTLTQYAGDGVDRELNVLRYTIVDYRDSVMMLDGTYTHTIGDSVYLTAGMGGLYTRVVEQP